ncbi:MAG TPA: hypothetical protein DD791_10710 [Syntrophomonas sp.]|jgi:hypothetical protein|nr:hypothetical protein [Syntrophomonas sp.]
MVRTLKKQWRNLFKSIAIIFFMIAIIAGSATLTWARDLPASTFLPFNNKQTINFNTTEDINRGIYPTEGSYIFISYKQDIMTGDQDIRAQKLDKDGKELWNKVYNLKGQDTLQIIHMLKNGFVMVVNSQQSKQNIIRLLAIGSNGEIVWQRELPLKTVNTIASTNDDGLVIAGTVNDDNLDIRIIKMDKSGIWAGEEKSAAKWEKTYSHAGNQQASQIIQVLDKEGYNDGYILTGYTDSNTNGKQDLYLVRLNAYGEIKWSKNYGSKDDDQGITLGVAVNSNNDEVIGFLVAGNTVSRHGDKNIYLIYVDTYGTLQSWPGHQRVVDGVKERQFGGPFEQIAMALVAVPDGFKESRKLRGENIDGQGGVVLVGYSSDNEKVLVIRINEYGQLLWQQSLPIPGDNLILRTLIKGDSQKQEIAYSVRYPGDKGANLEVHTLKVYLEGVLEQDKSIPKADQLETNGESVRWEKCTLKYEAMRNISKEIKDLLYQQPYAPRTAASTGRGEINWPDTSYYLGNLVIGKADGEGTLLFPNGVWYKGAWKNNMFNGKGYLRFPTGEYYQGEFKDHMMQGKGIMKWPTGEKYEGEFLNNQRDGQGKFIWKNGTFYEGAFSKGKASGMGLIRWPNGERYVGQMADGNATGQGSYYFPSGEWYRGEIKSLVFEGVGVYHWPDGSYYVGEFKGDRLNGEGYYVWPNGVQQWGYWKDDRYLGTNPEALKEENQWKSK